MNAEIPVISNRIGIDGLLSLYRTLSRTVTVEIMFSDFMFFRTEMREPLPRWIQSKRPDTGKETFHILGYVHRKAVYMQLYSNEDARWRIRLGL